MRKTILLAAIPVVLALTGCGEAAKTAEAPAVATDDNDAAEPVAEDHAHEGVPHDEAPPHDH